MTTFNRPPASTRRPTRTRLPALPHPQAGTRPARRFGGPRVDEIEARAAALLHRCAPSLGPIVAPPVPYELIADCLGLSIQPAPLAAAVPGVLGAIAFSRRLILIDVGCVGRPPYAFTVCHELGHWELHRQLGLAPPLPLPESVTGGAVDIVCRSGERGAIEREADRFAAALLMPEDLVRAAAHGLDAGDPLVVEALADRFGASRTAMQIRLDTLGLAPRVPPGQLRLF